MLFCIGVHLFCCCFVVVMSCYDLSFCFGVVIVLCFGDVMWYHVFSLGF